MLTVVAVVRENDGYSNRDARPLSLIAVNNVELHVVPGGAKT